MSRDGIIIVGAGQAGGWAAKTLRNEGYVGRIVLCGDEAVPPYERPPLSKDQLEPQAPDLPSLIDAKELAALGIEWRGRTVAVSIDRAGRKLLLQGGEALSYDKLILCMGGRPRVPLIDGIGLPQIFTLRTVGDAWRLREALNGQTQVAIIGGGWIGLEVAAAARKRDCSVMLLEAADRLCGRSGSAVLSDVLARLHRNQGVDVRFNTRVVSIQPQTTGGYRLMLKGGAEVQANVVVVGVGLVPNDELAREAGLACDCGVIVDRACRTSDPDIYAAGDITAMPGREGGLMRLESWQNAQDQGIAAARSALGQGINYVPVPYFWSQQYDTIVQIAGAGEPGAVPLIRLDLEAQLIVAELHPDGRLAATVCINASRDFRQLRRYIVEGTKIDAQRFSDRSVPLTKAAILDAVASS